ncbi:MAG TPA: 2-dehydropantoate 2-reductase [Methanothrix sp.]|nr:2-dehydropantoate 2-reductase [Methanothrix sp.]HQE87975.1 2-dehydropantoate 2-reductase [Methanothrix sp.]HQI67731.1 2-dehydropantoate 2-reductase [Methanothrix sp.]HRS85589.1 2-dehydropantoate 2-reductase [Methanothrix sp.]HRT17805.1 2-dehydropantoate 2-reductase [Methanothrix sp.]
MPDILIYGAGAIGSFMGYLLSEGPSAAEGMIENVGLLGREGHIKKIRERGLEIAFPDGAKSFRFKNCFSSLEELAASDFYPEMVMVCVKAYSLPALCQELAGPGLPEGRLRDAAFLLLMNGMGNKEAFSQLHLPASRLLEGITSVGVKLSGEGRIELKGWGKTVVEARLDAGMQKYMSGRLAEKGFEAEFADDFATQQWNKLFVNAVINPITALTRQENGIVLSQSLQPTVRQIVREAVGVAACEGVAADEESAFELVSSVAGKTAANTSSMLQDVLKGRMTEIDSINGYIVGLAKKHGLETPVNEAMVALVKSTSFCNE